MGGIVVNGMGLRGLLGGGDPPGGGDACAKAPFPVEATGEACLSAHAMLKFGQWANAGIQMCADATGFTNLLGFDTLRLAFALAGVETALRFTNLPKIVLRQLAGGDRADDLASQLEAELANRLGIRTGFPVRLFEKNETTLVVATIVEGPPRPHESRDRLHDAWAVKFVRAVLAEYAGGQARHSWRANSRIVVRVRPVTGGMSVSLRGENDHPA